MRLFCICSRKIVIHIHTYVHTYACVCLACWFYVDNMFIYRLLAPPRIQIAVLVYILHYADYTCSCMILNTYINIHSTAKILKQILNNTKQTNKQNKTKQRTNNNTTYIYNIYTHYIYIYIICIYIYMYICM